MRKNYIILILLLLTFFYYFYMLCLVAEGARSFIIITLLSVSYVICFVIIFPKPVLSLYAFLFITLFMPNGGNNWAVVKIAELSGISLSRILQDVAAFTICIHLLRDYPFKQKISKKLQQVCILISLTVIVSFSFSLVREIIGESYSWLTAVAPEELVWSAPLLHGVIFLYGCAVFISEIKQIERIFLIILMSGIGLFIEVVLYFYLELPLPLAERSVSVLPVGKTFRGLIFGDNLTTSMVCFMSIACLLYFIFSRNRKILLFFIPLFLMPSGTSFQRTPMAASLVVIGSFVLIAKRRTAAWKVILVSLIASSIVVIKVYSEMIFNIAFDIAKRRPGYFLNYLDSWSARFGAYLRGMDAVLFSFPMGTGPKERVYYYMNSTYLPDYLSSYIPTETGNEFYWHIASGSTFTSSHNFFIYFMAEYGLMGIVTISFFVVTCSSNFRNFLRDRSRDNYKTSKLILCKAAGYSGLFGLGIYSLFQHYLIYPLLFFFFFLTIFLPKSYSINPQQR